MHTFEVWAPTPESVRVEVDGITHEMDRTDDGWWRAEVDCDNRARYGFVVDGETLPDPRSPRQPEGVHLRSQLHQLDEASWTDSQWTGRQLPGSSVYELHIGTFTPEGTFDAAIERLDHLVDLGVGFVEIMPVNGFNGTHNWGYDGVLWYTVHEIYGGPDGLQRLVNAAHERGLGVILDVVYNHLGPSGNYLEKFGPYIADGANTWGRTINIGGPQSGEVREYIIGNALRWMRDFHIDGLRLDAVHALVDHTGTHILEELAVRTETLSAHLGRPLTLIAESDLNDATLITPRAAGGFGLDAQWDDDIHHTIHTAVSGERRVITPTSDPWNPLQIHCGAGSSTPERIPRSVDGFTAGRSISRISRQRSARIHVHPRSDRQPSDRRPPERLSDTRTIGDQGGTGPALAVHADAVHGRGMGSDDAVPVLHLASGTGTRRGHCQRPQSGVRGARLEQ